MPTGEKTATGRLFSKIKGEAKGGLTRCGEMFCVTKEKDKRAKRKEKRFSLRGRGGGGKSGGEKHAYVRKEAKKGEVCN